MSRGQVDGIIIVVSFITLALIGIVIASPSSMSGFFTAGTQTQATPTAAPIFSQYNSLTQYTPLPTPSAQPSYSQNGIPIIDQSYYPAPVIQSTPTPNPYYYNPYGQYQYPNYNYQTPSFFPNGTPYYPPGYQYNQYGYNNYYYPNGTLCYYPYYNCYNNYQNGNYQYNQNPYYNYPYYYSNYTGAYQASINVVSGLGPVNVFVDGTYRGSITNAGGSFMVFGLEPGYHTVYVSGYSCDKVQQVYATAQYQTTVSVCGDTVAGGRSFTTDGTYYLYQGDSVTSTNNAKFTFNGFSMWQAGQAALPQATFSVSPRTGSTQTATFTAGSEYYYDGGSIRINGAVQTGSGILFGVTVSSSGNLQPSPVGTRTLSGRIVDQNGTGIASAGIMLANYYNAQTYMNTRLSGSDGYYSLAYVPDGFYNVTVSAANHYSRTWNNVQITSDTYTNYDIATSTATPTPTPTATPTPTSTHYISTQSYLFSVPLASPVVASNTCANTTVNHFNPFNQSWYEIPMASINGNETYWLNATSPCTLSFNGSSYYNKANYYNALYPGWNAISAPYDGATYGQLSGNCNITAFARLNATSIFEVYNSTASPTGTAFGLEAGKGYVAYSSNTTLCAMYYTP